MKALRKMHRCAGAFLRKCASAVDWTGRGVGAGAHSFDLRTDLHIYGWDRWSQGRVKPPVTLGHEFCGVVERTGEEVTAVKAGDFVSAEMHINCGHCHQCRWAKRISAKFADYRIDQDGAFAEFVKIPASNIWKLDAAIPEHYRGNLGPTGKRGDTVLAGAIAGRRCWLQACGPWVDGIAVQGLRSSTVFATETTSSGARWQENGRGCGGESGGRRSSVAKIKAETGGPE